MNYCPNCGHDLRGKTTPNLPFDMGNYRNAWTGDDYCMHENCPGCKAGTCNGIHMMSCPCKKCSPMC